jgi:hypothetical protein
LLEVQRLFSSFPDGRAGAGLLILRITVAAGVVLQTESALALFVAAPLVAGFMTPAIAAGAAVIAMMADAPYVAAIAIALALLGPGAFSVDARLFGRREIVID